MGLCVSGEPKADARPFLCFVSIDLLDQFSYEGLLFRKLT